MKKPEMREVLKDFAREEQEHKIKLEDTKAAGMVLIDEEVASLGIADDVEGGEFHPDMSYAEILLFAIKKEDASVRPAFQLCDVFLIGRLNKCRIST